MAGTKRTLTLDADERFVARWALLAYRAVLQDRIARDFDQDEQARTEREVLVRRVEDLVQRLA